MDKLTVLKVGGAVTQNKLILDKFLNNLTNNAKFMHCLPIRRNVVASDEVIDSNNSLILNQVENRIYSAQFVLKTIIENG